MPGRRNYLKPESHATTKRGNGAPKPAAGIIQRPPLTRDLKEGSSVNVSALALIIRFPMEGSVAQCAIKPQYMSLHSLPPLCRTITGIVGNVSGAMLKRGVYLGRSRSSFQRTRMSLNSNVAVIRPHIYP